MTAAFRAGMVGAGHICEFHVAAVTSLPGVELVGITDLDGTRARANAARWGTKAYADLEALVAAGANVIHVLTPPSAHGKVAIAALERGCHVLVETPIAEDEADANKLGAIAAAKGLTVSVNHSLLYDPQVKRALAAVMAGAIGNVACVEILRGSEYPPYEGGPLPPWYRAAGYPFRDLGVHCMYLVQALLGTIEDVRGDWRSLGHDPNFAFDGWRGIVRCARGTGELELTWNTRPMRSQLIIHGTKGVLRVDLFAKPKAAERLVHAFADSIQPLIDVRKLVRAHRGLRDLVADFYRRLAAHEPPAVSVADAANVVRWVDKIARAADADHVERVAKFAVSEHVPYLVTGASGSVGQAVVKRLRADGHRVRVFVRRIPARVESGIEYCFGNLGDPVAVDRAVRGAGIVIHAGASMKGGWPEHKGGTVVGTQNVIDACIKHRT
ncbi:MAG TPA: Gfo/Idh/MocA family oxidoreductase, partial [Kofleriaceae bacterium]|nr:Gfo/Idh/MocA family oxidoreductase [Kofleriaceae bacterium]